MSLDTTLTQLETAQLVRRADDPSTGSGERAYQFKHALTQDAAYQSLLIKTRRQIHRSVGEAYVHLYPDRLDEFAALLSEHYWLGEVWDHAAEYALRAGTRSLRVYALREALSDYERALAALDRMGSPTSVRVYDALMGWEEAALKYRPYAEQLQHLAQAEQIARDLNDKARLARVLFWIGRVHSAQGHNLRAIAPLTECFRLARELGDERLAVIPTLFMGISTVDTSPREAITLFERAIELARDYDDVNTEAVSWSTKAMSHALLGESAPAKAALESAFATLERVSSPATESDVYLFAAWTWLYLGNWEKGSEIGQLCVNTALAADNMDCMCGGFDCLGFNRLAEQDLPKAIEAFKEAIRRSKYSGADIFENLGRAGLALAEFYNGRGDAIAELEHVYARAREMNDQRGAALMAQSLGAIYARRGDTANAESYIDFALDYYRRAGMRPFLAQTLESAAALYQAQDRAAQAARARAEAEALRKELSG